MKIFRYCFLFCITLLATSAVFGQNLKLSDEPGQFITQFRKLMDGSRNPQYIRAAAQLDSVWMSSVGSAQQNKFISIVRTQIAKGQKAGPVLFLLTRNAHAFAKQSPENFDGFLDLASQAGEKYDGKSFQKVLETIRTINETNKLYSTNYNSLYLLGGTYRFRFDTTNAVVANKEAAIASANDSWDAPVDTNYVIAPKSNPLPVVSGAVLELQNAIFGMVAAGDSVVFGPTNGSIALQDGIFIGKSGKFNWAAAGDSSIYVDLDAYSFNISQPKIVAENVTLHDDRQLASPVKGTMEYRGTKKVRGQSAPYPRFVSNGIDARLKASRKNIDYKGGYALIGTTMFSSSLSDQPSTVSVTYKEKPAFKVQSKKFNLRDSVISAPFATYSMPLGTDSLYHPGVTFSYNDDEGVVKLGRAEKTDYAPLPYQDSYHKMNIWAQAMRWKFPNDKVEFLRIDGKQVVPVKLESFDYFKKERFKGISQEFGFQPMLLAANYTQTQKKSSFLSEELASILSKTQKYYAVRSKDLPLMGTSYTTHLPTNLH